MIADLTGVEYINIALAALIPAMFYYVSLFSAVSVEAARLGIEPVPVEERQKLSRQDIYLSSIFIIPILTIIFVLVAGRSAASAGFWATIVAAALGFLHPDFRKNPSKLVISLIRGGEQCAKIMVAVAAVGISANRPGQQNPLDRPQRCRLEDSRRQGTDCRPRPGNWRHPQRRLRKKPGEHGRCPGAVNHRRPRDPTKCRPT